MQKVSGRVRLFSLFLGILFCGLIQSGPVLPEPTQEAQVKYEGEYEVEQEVDIGFGFRAVTLLVPTPWEFAHFGYLYYHDQRVSRAGTLAIAPSGDYAIFQDPTGNLFLYRRADGRKARLTCRFVPNVDNFIWHDSGRVDALYDSGQSKSYFIGPETHWSWFF